MELPPGLKVCLIVCVSAYAAAVLGLAAGGSADSTLSAGLFVLGAVVGTVALFIAVAWMLSLMLRDASRQ